MLKTILLDIGNVLVHLRSHDAIDRQSFMTGLSVPKLHQILFEQGLLNRLEVGQLSKEQFLDHIRLHSQKEFLNEDMIAGINDMFSENTLMTALLPKFKQKGIRLVIVSNTNDIHYPFLRNKYEFFSYFDQNILSHKIGFSKPHREFYQKALEAAECEAHECLFVDDLDKNIAAAREAGFHGVIYSNHSMFLEVLSTFGLCFN
jgi:glucose-1-phosphatase